MSYPDTKPLTSAPAPAPSYPAVVGATAPAAPHQGMIWLDNSASPIVLKIYDNNVWTPLPSGSAPAGAFIPFSQGKIYTTKPATPNDGDVWFDQSKNPPSCNYYKAGVWAVYDFINPPNFSLGFLGDLINVDLGSNKPDFGDALIFNPLREMWEAGSVPAHITHWGSATNYANGAVVYHNGGFFESNQRTIGDSPDFKYGDASFYRRANKNGTGQFQGPFQFEAVNIVVDSTIAPTNTPTTNQPHYTLQYTDSTHWAVWHWDLQMPPGYRPGIDPLPTYQWHNLSATYNPAKTKEWRTWSAPTSAFGDFILWIYDNPRGTTVPHQRKIVWNLLEVRKDMFALHDVLALNPATDDILRYGADQNWHSGPISVAVPATPTSPGDVGQIAYDATHVYHCVSLNTWVRVARETTGGW